METPRLGKDEMQLKNLLEDNPELMDELEQKIMDTLKKVNP